MPVDLDDPQDQVVLRALALMGDGLFPTAVKVPRHARSAFKPVHAGDLFQRSGVHNSAECG